MSEEIIFGIHAVNNLLERSPERVRELYILKGRDDERFQALFKLAKQNGVSIQSAKKGFLDEIADGTHQGVVAKSTPAKSRNESQLFEQLDELSGSPFLLILDSPTVRSVNTIGCSTNLQAF